MRDSRRDGTKQVNIALQFFKFNGLPEPVAEHRFHPERRWRFDYAFLDAKVALEVEGGVWAGGRHTSSKGFLGDIEKYSEAAAAGWLIVRCTPKNLCTLTTVDRVKRAIASRKEIFPT